MKNKKLTRTCIGCRAKKEKQELIRFVKSSKDEILIDTNQNMERKRSIYL